jgi:hypothetical protein
VVSSQLPGVRRPGAALVGRNQARPRDRLNLWPRRGRQAAQRLKRRQAGSPAGQPGWGARVAALQGVDASQAG